MQLFNLKRMKFQNFDNGLVREVKFLPYSINLSPNVFYRGSIRAQDFLEGLEIAKAK